MKSKMDYIIESAAETVNAIERPERTSIVKRGSQNRESIENTDYTVVKFLDKNKSEVILQDESGKKELWVQRDDFAGYVIEIDGMGYEFVRSC